MKKIMRPLLALLIPAVALVSSCKKEDVKVKNSGKTSSDSIQFYTSIDSDINSIDETVDEASGQTSNDRVAAGCYNVSFSKDTAAPVPGFVKNYRKFTLSFSGNCDSLTRTGQVVVFKSGSWLTRDYKDSIVFSGYSTDGRSISGYKTRTFNASTDLKNLVFSFSTNVTLSDSGQTIHYQASGTKTIVNYLLPAIETIQITGNGLFVGVNGNQVSYTITNPIVLNGSCQRKFRFPVQGTISYTNTFKNQSSVVDYGNGTCDKLATISVDGGAAVTFKLK